MDNPTAFPAILVFGVLLVAGTSSGQDGTRHPPGKAAPEERVRELERQVSSLQAEVRRLRQELDAASVRVAVLKNADPAQAADLVRGVYGDEPGVAVEALPRLRGVAVRADANAAREIGELLGSLDRLAAGYGGPFAFPAFAPVRIPEEALLAAGLRAAKARSKSRDKK